MYRLTLTVTMVVTLAIAQSFLATPQATAAVIAVDNFESYELGSILEQGTSGDGWTSTWGGLNSTKTSAVPLRDVSSGVMAGFGQSLELGFDPPGGEGATNHNIVQRSFDPQTETIYLGFAIRTVGFDNGGITPAYFGDLLHVYVNNTVDTSATVTSRKDAMACGIDYAPPPDGDDGAYFVRKGGASEDDDQTPTAFTHTNEVVHRMVMKISKSSLDIYDQVALFVNQETEGTPDAARGELDETTPSFDTVSVLHVRIWGMELDDRVFVDELRIATTYAEALPELPILEPVPGDTNDDRIVDDVDAKVLATRWGQTGLTGGYSVGDFNADGTVDARDAAIQAAQWGNHTGGEAAAVAGVPEPGAIVLLLGLVLAALPRRLRG